MEWSDYNTIRKILDRNIKEIPYEGTEIDKEGIIQELVEFIDKFYDNTVKDIKKEIEHCFLNIKRW